MWVQWVDTVGVNKLFWRSLWRSSWLRRIGLVSSLRVAVKLSPLVLWLSPFEVIVVGPKVSSPVVALGPSSGSPTSRRASTTLVLRARAWRCFLVPSSWRPRRSRRFMVESVPLLVAWQCSVHSVEASLRMRSCPPGLMLRVRTSRLRGRSGGRRSRRWRVAPLFGLSTSALRTSRCPRANLRARMFGTKGVLCRAKMSISPT
jgi:hypothetical protein